MRLRVWSEFLSFQELRSPSILDLLERFQVGVCAQVMTFDGLAPVLRAYAGRGLELAVWLLLPNEQGYWPSERNLDAYRARVDALLAWAEGEGVRIPWLAVDLERPLWQAQQVSASQGLARWLVEARLARSNLSRVRFLGAQRGYRELAERARATGVRLLCAAHDYVRDDLLAGSARLQDLHEAPVLGVPWDVLSTMLYTSLDRQPAAARRWLYEVALDVRRCLGDRAGASVGLTSVGALGSEPCYARPDELAPDVAALKAAGIGDIAIYSLEGILGSGDPASWLEMARSMPAAVPPPTAGSRRRALRHRLLRLALRILP